MKTIDKKQKLPSLQEKDAFTSSKVLRFVLENIWLLALPLFALIYIAIVSSMNSYDLSGIPFLRLLQALGAAIVLGVIFGVISRIGKTAFHRAKEDLDLLHRARTLARHAKSSLSRFSAEKKHHIRVALNSLKQAIRTGTGIGEATHALESLLPQDGTSSKAGLIDYFGSLFIAFIVALLLRGFLVGNFVIPSGSMIPTLQVGDHIFVNQLVYGLGIPFTTIKFGMHIREPKPGEIIVFSEVKTGERDLIKRVIAIPHDTITYCRGTDTIQINGQELPQQTESESCSFVDKHNPESDELSDWYFANDCRFITENNRGQTYRIQKTDAPGTLAEGDSLPPFVAKSFRPTPNRPDCYSYEVPADHVFVMGDNRDHSADSRYFGPVPYERIKGKAWRIWWSDGAKFVSGKAQPHAPLERIFQAIK